MGRRAIGWAVIAGAVSATAVGCSLIASGILDDAASQPDAATPAEGGREAATDGSAPSDADARAAVPEGGENCTNGVDDNGDGLVDCADPFCVGAGFICVPPAPSGWSYAGLVAGSPPACGAGTTAAPLVMDISAAPAVCTCGCSVTQPPTCESGSIQVLSGTSACTASSTIPAGDGNCADASLDFSYYKAFYPPGPTGGACADSVGASLPTPTSTQVTACENAMAGAGCSAGKVCSWNGPGGTCLVVDGGAACPPAYPHGHDAGSAIEDMRDCGACSGCTVSGTCSNGVLSTYGSPGCTGGGGVGPVPVDGGCGFYGSLARVTFYRYSATPLPACTPGAGGVPSGGVALLNPSTVCCGQ